MENPAIMNGGGNDPNRGGRGGRGRGGIEKRYRNICLYCFKRDHRASECGTRRGIEWMGVQVIANHGAPRCRAGLQGVGNSNFSSRSSSNSSRDPEWGAGSGGAGSNHGRPYARRELNMRKSKAVIPSLFSYPGWRERGLGVASYPNARFNPSRASVVFPSARCNPSWVKIKQKTILTCFQSDHFPFVVKSNRKSLLGIGKTYIENQHSHI